MRNPKEIRMQGFSPMFPYKDVPCILMGLHDQAVRAGSPPGRFWGWTGGARAAAFSMAGSGNRVRGRGLGPRLRGLPGPTVWPTIGGLPGSFTKQGNFLRTLVMKSPVLVLVFVATATSAAVPNIHASDMANAVVDEFTIRGRRNAHRDYVATAGENVGRSG